MRSIWLNPLVQLPMWLYSRFWKTRAFVLKVNLSSVVSVRRCRAPAFAELICQFQLVPVRCQRIDLRGFVARVPALPPVSPSPPSPTAADTVVSSVRAAFRFQGAEIRDKLLLGQA